MHLSLQNKETLFLLCLYFEIKHAIKYKFRFKLQTYKHIISFRPDFPYAYERLLRLALLIPSSTSGVESSFSIMILLVSPLCTSCNENNIDQLMIICLDGPEFLSKERLEKIIDIYKYNAPCRISL